MDNLTSLLERARLGDEQAEAELFCRLRRYIRTLATSRALLMARGDLDESDLAQLTLYQVAKSIGEYRGSTDAQIKGWIREIFKHKEIDLSRRNLPATLEGVLHVDLSLWNQLPGDSSTPSHRAIRKEQSRLLAAALTQLPQDQYVAIRLRHIEGLSIPEISRQIDGRSDDAVRQLIRRGMVNLGKILADVISNV